MTVDEKLIKFREEYESKGLTMGLELYIVQQFLLLESIVLGAPEVNTDNKVDVRRYRAVLRGENFEGTFEEYLVSKLMRIHFTHNEIIKHKLMIGEGPVGASSWKFIWKKEKLMSVERKVTEPADCMTVEALAYPLGKVAVMTEEEVDAILEDSYVRTLSRRPNEPTLKDESLI